MKGFLITLLLGAAAVVGFQSAGCIERRAEARALAADPVADDAEADMAPGGGGDCITRCNNQADACRKAGNSETTCAGSYNSCMLQCNTSSTLVDPGIATSPDPESAIRVGWPLAAMVLLAMIISLLRKTAWARHGAVAFLVGAAAVAIGAGVDAAAAGGSWMAVLSAVLAAIIAAWQRPQSAGSTRIPKAIDE